MKLQFNASKAPKSSFRIIELTRYLLEVSALPEGDYLITITKKRKEKSRDQLGYLFAIVYPLFLKALQDAGWEMTTIEEVDEFCKWNFTRKPVINKHTGEVIELPSYKRKMSTLQMSTYIDQIRDASSELGFYIPVPDEAIQAEQENETKP